jgi:hypothetical protein
MKLKRSTASTGHGTGLLMPRELHESLRRRRIRKFEKKRVRVERQQAHVERWSKLSPKSSFVLSQRLQSLVSRVEAGAAALVRLSRAIA